MSFRAQHPHFLRIHIFILYIHRISLHTNSYTKLCSVGCRARLSAQFVHIITTSGCSCSGRTSVKNIPQMSNALPTSSGICADVHPYYYHRLRRRRQTIDSTAASNSVMFSKAMQCDAGLLRQENG